MDKLFGQLNHVDAQVKELKIEQMVASPESAKVVEENIKKLKEVKEEIKKSISLVS